MATFIQFIVYVYPFYLKFFASFSTVRVHGKLLWSFGFSQISAKLLSVWFHQQVTIGNFIDTMLLVFYYIGQVSQVNLRRFWPRNSRYLLPINISSIHSVFSD
jgi:hypothetical protein